MSLIGIDIGTSAVKVAAFSIEGNLLAAAHRALAARRTHDGAWEVDVQLSRRAVFGALREVAASAAARRDPPTALSFSSSGREVFPVGKDGEPLGPCLTTADARGDQDAIEVAALLSRREWFRVAGHLPERMDPICRIRWWCRTSPDVARRARWFMNWHEFYALQLAGCPVVDRSDAGAWAVYDLATDAWSDERIQATGIDPAWLPQIQPSGTAIGPILPAVASRLGLPRSLMVVTGAWDAYAAAVGSAALEPGDVALSCGTWSTFVLPIREGWPDELANLRVGIHPHPGRTGLGLLSADPNGMSVAEWACRLTRVDLARLDDAMTSTDTGPGPVRADPRLTPVTDQVDHAGGGTFAGITLRTTGWDLVKALLEAVACRLGHRLDELQDLRVPTSVLRATGGGTRSAWYMQLTADLTGMPVEVADVDEPGAFGASILAGLGVGAYDDVPGVRSLVRTARRFDPHPDRRARYAEMLAAWSAPHRTA